MADIYALHDKAFANVSAYVILKDGSRVATISFKFPKDGAGRLWAYVHWIGVEMVRGHADGYGYDKRSAAVANAQRKIMVRKEEDRKAFEDPDMKAFLAALSDDNGYGWDRRLQDAGFVVMQAV